MVKQVSRYTLLSLILALIGGVLVFDYFNQYQFSIGKYSGYMAILLSVIIIATKVIGEFLLFLSNDKLSKVIGAVVTILLFSVAIYVNTEIRAYNNDNEVKKELALNDNIILKNEAIDRKINTIEDQLRSIDKSIESKQAIIKTSEAKYITLRNRIGKSIDKLNKDKIVLIEKMDELRDSKQPIKPITTKQETRAESIALSILIESSLILFIFTFSKIYKAKIVVNPTKDHKNVIASSGQIETFDNNVKAENKQVDRITPDYLKEIRKSNGITQKDLSDILGVNQASISKIERGQLPIPINAIDKLKEAELLEI